MTEDFDLQLEDIHKASRVTLQIIVNIEDDDHHVEIWETSQGETYFYVEDIVKRAGECRILFDSEGNAVLQLLPEAYIPLSDIYWTRVSKVIHRE